MIIFMYVNFIVATADKMVTFAFQRVGHPDIKEIICFFRYSTENRNTKLIKEINVKKFML